MTINQARKLQRLVRWHRRIALLVMLWLAWLAATGILVNHAHDWGLDERPLPAALQQWVYGIGQAPEVNCDGLAIEPVRCSRSFARLELPFGAALLASHDIYLFDESGTLLEQLPVSQAGLSRLDAGKVVGSQVLLKGPEGTVAAGEDWLDFTLLDGEAAVTGAAYAWQVRHAELDSVNWERLVLDLHAARFLGPFAKGFTDLMAILILLLAASGAWLHRVRKNANGLSSGRT